MAGSNELCGLTVITEICKKEHIRGNAEILKQLLAEFCETPVTNLIENSDVTPLGGGQFEIAVIDDPRDGYIAITEDLTFYEFDGSVWVLKFAGLGDFIASATDNGDDTYTFTSFDGNTSFTIAIPLLSIKAGPGIDVDVTDPKRPSVGLNQATQDNNAYVSQVKQFLEIDANQIFSKRGLNEISDPDRDMIISVDWSQPNKILGVSGLRNIVGGYDNTINDNIASSIFGSHHSSIDGTAGHNVIIGGSQHVMQEGAYASILGGSLVTANFGVGLVAATRQASIVAGDYFVALGCSDLIATGGASTRWVFVGSSKDSKINATGAYNAIVGGNGNEVAGVYGFIGQGSLGKVEGNRSFIGNGNSNYSADAYSTVLNGTTNSSLGKFSTVINGDSSTAHSFGETVCGIYPTDYTAVSTSSRANPDRIFTIGIGSSVSDRKDAYKAFKNGRNQFRFINIEQITPTTKIDGDIWFDGTDLKMRVGGVDKTFTLT